MSKKKILVIIDCQTDFITGALRNEDAIKTVPNIVKKVNSKKWDFILLTRDTHTEDYLNTREGQKLPVEHCIKGTKGWEIEESVMTAVEESKIPYAVYDKFTFGLFDIADDLEFELDKNDIDYDGEDVYIEVCGFCTDICVVSNTLLLKANFYDWADITVDSKCCAGVTPESHEAALTTMKMCQIDVL